MFTSMSPSFFPYVVRRRRIYGRYFAAFLCGTYYLFSWYESDEKWFGEFSRETSSVYLTAFYQNPMARDVMWNSFNCSPAEQHGCYCIYYWFGRYGPFNFYPIS